MKILEIKNVNKSYGKNHVLKDISFDMEQGDVIAIIGSSGGGKSTLLRCLTFLEKMQSGSLAIGGEEIVVNVVKDINKVNVLSKLSVGFKKKFGKKAKKGSSVDDLQVEQQESELEKIQYHSIYPKDKVLRQKALKMGLVFQDFNLFPHKTVLENLILAPMKVLKMNREVATELALEQLAKVGLSEKANAYPCDISGGQKQRVAIARALCMKPEILCFDEPTSALDPELTGEVLKVISELRQTNVTMLIVTHEIMFAREIADKVIFLDNGCVLEMGNAKDIIDNPEKERTQEFMNKILKG